MGGGWQDPVLFSGSLRDNLDPFVMHSDSRVWEVLSNVQLKKVVSEMGGLQGTVGECGDNLSAGQKQLVCLARAMLREAKLFALDEVSRINTRHGILGLEDSRASSELW